MIGAATMLAAALARMSAHDDATQKRWKCLQ
ncbi:hypothetical protein L288_08245 [Sphingobium quisquiliarum P25]|uniref:Uncharacterized protein n=1 Tax=Sphingobium quisquiliarum P25 TaxID=1329909 RepID=T0H8D5_9SPHN|nr:hypothetical protein L288_08245 [Sphingobium quisquiliarum P25]